MKNFGLIGYPLGHSMSPVIHRELFKINNIDASYMLKEINPEIFQEGINELDDFAGYNVTIPHKLNIIPYLDKLSGRAELFGAVNTVEKKDGMLIGHNTDCYGLLRAMEMADIKLEGNVLLCGCGGASRMAAFESVLAGADLTIAVRSADVDAGKKLQSEIKDKLNQDCGLITLDEVEGEYDLLINGTPVGMYPNVDACVLPEEKVQACKAVFDIVYNPTETQLVKIAKKSNIKCSNGLSMLVWQAAVAQEIWLGVKFTAHQVKTVLEITEREMEK
ncbi:MAG: shikimate dehydrogenase [Acetobacter sp.]|nr:shikimate dehydrogenase [Bacteroides sp.]MCM1340863.1 shikimate dehydrogenase [Acetobacter sp.]MCM1432580.1 shikimate dehydrogenase [Clostridiales bacterium]